MAHWDGLPTTQEGFSPLDVELAALMARLVPEGLDWWCAAAAVVSRAYAGGHTAVLRPSQGHPQNLGSVLSPAKSAQRAAFQAFLTRWQAAADVHPVMPPEVAATGFLVQEGAFLSLHRLWTAECRVAQALADRARTAPRVPAGIPGIPGGSPGVEELIERWLPSSPALPSHDQQAACRQALVGGFTVITGGPGTGKTHTAARLIALLQRLRPPESPPWRIGLAAPTGKAAARLRQALEAAWQGLRQQEPADAAWWDEAWAQVGLPRTVHAWLADWARQERASRPLTAPHGASPAGLPLDVLIVDEASMLDLNLLDRLVQALPPQSRLILIGDRDQLSSVEAGAVMADICQALDGRPELVPLRHSRRFREAIGRWALGVRQGDPRVLQELATQVRPDHQQLLDLALGEEGWGPVFREIQALKGASPDDGRLAAVLTGLDRFRILAAVRQGVWGVEGLNASLMQALARQGWGTPGDPWRHGQLLMVTRNDESTGLRNGDVGVIIHATPGASPQFVSLAGHTVLRIGASRLPLTEPAYAMTVHKSQGSEFDHVAMVLPQDDTPVVSREWLYTGLTRARHRVSWFGTNPSIVESAGVRSTLRMSSLAGRLRALLA